MAGLPPPQPIQLGSGRIRYLYRDYNGQFVSESRYEELKTLHAAQRGDNAGLLRLQARLRKTFRDPDAVREIQADFNQQRTVVGRLPLAGADFSDLSLSGLDLHDADLPKAHLTKCDLSQADLRNADLREADLAEAVLRDAAGLIL